MKAQLPYFLGMCYAVGNTKHLSATLAHLILKHFPLPPAKDQWKSPPKAGAMGNESAHPGPTMPENVEESPMIPFDFGGISMHLDLKQKACVAKATPILLS